MLHLFIDKNHYHANITYLNDSYLKTIKEGKMEQVKLEDIRAWTKRLMSQVIAELQQIASENPKVQNGLIKGSTEPPWFYGYAARHTMDLLVKHGTQGEKKRIQEIFLIFGLCLAETLSAEEGKWPPFGESAKAERKLRALAIGDMVMQDIDDRKGF